MNPLSFIRAFLKVKAEIAEQKKTNKTFLIPYMKLLEEKYGGKFPEAQQKKILNYYGLFITSILCSSYKRIYGKKLSVDERERVSLFGILTPVGDDLFDIDKLNIESIRAITFEPDKFIATSFTSSVAKEIQSYLLKNVPFKNEYISAAKNVFEIQLETIKQTEQNITDDEIAQITYAKGGYSVIIYHQTLNETASDAMLTALFHVGSLMQLANDCFDVYKDLKDGIFTLASRCNNYRTLKLLYINRVKETNRLIMALPFSNGRKQIFCIIMHAVIAQGLVAIDQLIALEDKLGASIDYSKLERKQLICDMQKPSNVIKWIYYALQLPGLK